MPTPSGAGQTTAGASFFSPAAGAGGLRVTGPLPRVCAAADAARSTIARSAMEREGFSRASMRPNTTSLQIRVEEFFHTMPRVTQHVLSREVMKLSRVAHERDELAFALLHHFIEEPHRVQVWHVHVRRAVKHEQRTFEPVDVRERRRVRVDLGMLVGRTDPARGPAAVIGIL